jgi:hypothetical protein
MVRVCEKIGLQVFYSKFKNFIAAEPQRRAMPPPVKHLSCPMRGKLEQKVTKETKELQGKVRRGRRMYANQS